MRGLGKYSEGEGGWAAAEEGRTPGQTGADLLIEFSLSLMKSRRDGEQTEKV